MLLPRKEYMQFAKDHGSTPQHYYSIILGWFYRQKLELLYHLLDQRKQGKVLEIGYGSGISLKELSVRFDEVYAIDIHDFAASVQTMLYREAIRNVTLYHHDIFSSPVHFESGFDCAVSSSVFEHLPPDAILRGVKHIFECLKPRGVFLIGFPLKTFLMNSLFKLYEMTYKQLHRMYDFRLEHDHPSGQNEIIPALKEYFRIQKMHYFLGQWVPLYIVLECVKK